MKSIIILFMLSTINGWALDDDGPPVQKTSPPKVSPQPITPPQNQPPQTQPQPVVPQQNEPPQTQPQPVAPQNQPPPMQTQPVAPLQNEPSPTQPQPVTSAIQPQSVTSPRPSDEPNGKLYNQGEFPGGPRLKPQNIMKDGSRGCWLIGKFILINEDDPHHYTIQSHIDSTGIGFIDMSNKLGGGHPITVHLTIVQPPDGGLPQEFSYGPQTPLKVIRLQRNTNEVWAIDLTRRH